MKLDDALRDGMSVDGAIGIALVDMRSGMLLGKQGGNQLFDLDMAGALNTEVLRAKLRTMDLLGLNEKIDDILVTLGSQYHLIRPVTGGSGKGLFMYLALNRDRANLAMARHRLRSIERTLEL